MSHAPRSLLSCYLSPQSLLLTMVHGCALLYFRLLWEQAGLAEPSKAQMLQMERLGCLDSRGKGDLVAFCVWRRYALARDTASPLLEA